MEVEAFISKWKANQRAERAAAHEHFIDLCSLLGEPTPNSDPDGSTYAFEKGATKATGGEGWADVWRRGCFGWEYKGKHRDLEAAHRQLLLYAGALENPPLLIVSDIERIIVRTNWTNAVSTRHEFHLEDIRDPVKRALLKSIWSEPDRFRPTKTRQALTEEAAADFAELAGRLRKRGHDAQAVAHFINRLVFCLFADDVGLLPIGLLERMLSAAQTMPGRFVDFAARLFRAMKDPGGEIDFTPVQWFNGGLFDDDTALPLEAEDIRLLNRVASLDWAEVDPSILGTLFERGLDPDKRSQLGAHYTDREKIGRLVEAAIERPLLREWNAVKAEILAADDRATSAKNARAKNAARLEMRKAYQRFLDRIRSFRVLDPACGSGNFLYVSLLALKDLELRASVEAEALGLPREFNQVGPEAVHGIEINPYAAELARVSVWIGHIQWARRNGLPPPANPVLRPLETIECRDAIINPDGTPASWPKAHAIVGNPPYLGAKLMKRMLGVEKTEAIRTIYADRLPGFTDLVCYWFENARSMVEAGLADRAALVATNSIRKNTNLPVLRRIVATTPIFEAWSEERWTIDGANVDVSLICFARSPEPARLNGQEVSSINADLTAGFNLTMAHSLRENRKGAFLGIQKSGPFDVSGTVARNWMQEPANPNGRTNAEILKPYWNGDDLTGRPRDMWLIDLPLGLARADASLFVLPFQHVATTTDEEGRSVEELRAALGERAGPRWWEPHWPRKDMRSRIQKIPRYIVTPETAQHRLFVWLSYPVLPDKNLIVIPRDDDLMFGLLHSRFHAAWSLRKGSDLQDRPRYTHTTTFATYPFPEGMTPDVPANTALALPSAPAIGEAAANLDRLRNAWLYPSDLIRFSPEIVEFPEEGWAFPERVEPVDDRASRLLTARTLTALYNECPEWLSEAHRALDDAVAAAYGWPATISNDDALAALLALNLERSKAN